MNLRFTSRKNITYPLKPFWCASFDFHIRYWVSKANKMSVIASLLRNTIQIYTYTYWNICNTSQHNIGWIVLNFEFINYNINCSIDIYFRYWKLSSVDTDKNVGVYQPVWCVNVFVNFHDFFFKFASWNSYVF